MKLFIKSGSSVLRGVAASVLLVSGSAGVALAQTPQTYVDVTFTNVAENLATRTVTFDVNIAAGTGYVPDLTAGTTATTSADGDFTALDVRFDVDNIDAQAPPITSIAINPLATPTISTVAIANQSVATGKAYKISITRAQANLDITPIPLRIATITLPFSGPNTGLAVNATIRTAVTALGSSWSNPTATGTRRPVSGGTVPLPVELLDFSAIRASDGVRSQLSWTTATETGADYYEVERSATEAGAYSSIGVRVKAAGTSTQKLTYQTYDRSPLTGMNWYRLKIADLSGRVGYSDARSVRFDGRGVGESVSFGPNPLTRENTGSALLKVSAVAAQTLSYTISDASGKLVGGGTLEVLKGVGTYGVSGLERLSAGTYYLNAKGATINQTLKISKTE